MAATLTATVQTTTPPRVVVTASGLTGASLAVVYRVSAGQRTAVRPAPLPSGNVVVLTDQEAPLGRPVSYVISVTRAGATTDEATAGPVTLTAPGGLPILSDPLRGQGVSATIVTWPELTYAPRTAVVLVAGRMAPIVETDVVTSATSTVEMYAPTQAVLNGLRALLWTGQTVLLRAPCEGVEDAYLVPLRLSEQRRGTPGKGWARMVVLEAQHVDAPAMMLAAVGDTLGDLNRAVPTTLRDIANRWPGTLLDIATANLASM